MRQVQDCTKGKYGCWIEARQMFHSASVRCLRSICQLLVIQRKIVPQLCCFAVRTCARSSKQVNKNVRKWKCEDYAFCVSFIMLHSALKKRKNKNKKQRRWWSSYFYRQRRQLIDVNSMFLLNDLLIDENGNKFKNFTRMSEDFTFFLNGIKDKI